MAQRTLQWLETSEAQGEQYAQGREYMSLVKTNLHGVKVIELTRVQNGWLVKNNQAGSYGNEQGFAFESTESLARQLVDLLGKSGWNVTTPLPQRDDKGHFVAQK